MDNSRRHIPQPHPWGALQIYHVYRFCLAFLLLGLHRFNFGHLQLGQNHQRLFVMGLVFYGAFALLAMLVTYRRWSRFSLQVNSWVLLDISLLSIALYASGGG